jgi:hypothetical protein
MNAEEYLQHLQQEVSVYLLHQDFTSDVFIMSLSKARDYRIKCEEIWIKAGFKRKYTNSRYKGRDLDKNLWVKGKKWRKLLITTRDGTEI